MRIVSRNNPIATVIKNYTNKKSGKVTDSRNEIQRRFFGLDWKDQKKIMVAFLDAGVSDRNWAYSRLFDLWDASFEPQVQALWETYHEEKCAWVIIRHFPKEYLREHIDLFHEGRNYYFICRRLAEDSDFVIDKSKMSKTDYLMALSHAERHIDDVEATDTLYEIVRDIAFHWNPSMELSRDYASHRHEVMTASDFANVFIALYYLEKMGNDDVVTVFRMWESRVRSIVSDCEEYKGINREPISDYDYKEKLASIVQKHLYYALPKKYKIMTDEEYDKRAEASDESARMNMADAFAAQMSQVITSIDENEDDFPF
jgi:hypothetical protein